MRLRKHQIFYVFAVILILGITTCQYNGRHAAGYFQAHLVNLDHLDSLYEDVVIQGDSVAIIHIYADYPDYAWVDAGDEGIACVDDAARAVVVYLRYYELTGDRIALKKARNLLNFVLSMQSADGEFYNFIHEDLRINRTGRTSQKSFDFWAARGYWALAYGYRVFHDLDRDFAVTLKDRFQVCKLPLRNLMKRYGQYERFGEKRYPAWLIKKFGGDATSELLLGMEHYFKLSDDNELKKITEKLVEGILEMQLKNGDQFEGVFLSWRGIWHAYANCQTQALAVLGAMLDQLSWLDAAATEANLFYPHLLQEGFLRSFSIGQDVTINRFDQIAYGVRPVFMGLVNLFDITGNSVYGENAGLAAAWFFGRNDAGQIMFDVNTGRCFDGINSKTDINMNSGAESTIEALMCLLEVASHPAIYKSMMNWQKQNNNIRIETNNETR